MNKFQITILFDWEEEHAELVTSHRKYINRLILDGVVDHYAVSMESQRIWITINASSKDAIDHILAKSPLYKFWSYQIDELYVIDGMNYRLPALQLN
jgi:hypothetical protein